MSRMSKNTRDSQLLKKDGCNIQCLGMEYQYALKQYSKALKGIRESIARDEHDLRTSLITCLLVFCFETLQGRERPAHAIALSGLALFHQRGNGSNMAPAVSMSSSCLLEEELLSAFASLDIQILCFYDGRSLTEHLDIIDDATKALKAMPSRFVSLEEAKFFWQIMIRRNLHLKANAEAEVNPAESRTKLESIAQTADTPAYTAASQLHIGILKEHSAEIQYECRRYIMDIHKWTKATSEVFKSVTRTDHNWVVITSLLQIHAKASLIAVASLTFTNATSFDAFLPEFRAFTNLAASIHPQLIESSQKSGVHHVDVGIVPALYLVGTRCRDRVVRAKAIDLLYLNSYREGIWDSIATANVANWIRSVEVNCNGGRDDHIPEQNRVISAKINLDLYNRTAKVYCTQRNGPTDANLIFHEGFISW